MKLEILNNYSEMVAVAADIFAKQISEKPDSVLCLATGSTPVGVYQNLIKKVENKEISFKDVKTFNLDEYQGLDANHPESYRYFMNDNLFNHIDINIDNTKVPSGVGNLDEIAKEYDAAIDAAGGIDLLILGIGSNGHIAFNEPGTPFGSYTHTLKLDERTRMDNARFFDGNIDEVPTHAITMGIYSIIRAKKIILLANGKHKARAVKETVQGEITTDVPASILQVHPDVTIIMDHDAASFLGD